MILWVVLLATSSCKKNDLSRAEGLPPITDTGANTFGCMVNGKVYRNHWVHGSWQPSLQCYYEYVAGQRFFTLIAENGDWGKAIAFNMNGFELHGDTVFNYTNVIKDKGISARYGTLGGMEYATYQYCAGEFHLTHFAEKKSFAAGTFWFDAVDSLTGDTVHVRDGRFDIGY